MKMKTPKSPQPPSRLLLRTGTSANNFLPLAFACLAVFNGSLLVCRTALAANVLLNPGFETGTTASWVKYGVFDINSTNNTYYNGGSGGSNVLVYDGLYVGKTYGQFTGADNYNGVYQDVNTAPTAVFTADGHLYTSSEDHISGADVAWIEVHFLDSGNNTLALYQTALITPDTSGTPVDLWLDYHVTNQISPVSGPVTNLVAPSGTAKVRYQIVFHQPAGSYDGGSVYWDDANLNEISGPIPPAISNFQPNSAVLLQATNALSFTAIGAAAITNISVVLNGVDISSSLAVTGSTTNKGVSYAGLQTNKLNIANVSVTDANGINASATYAFDTFDPNNFTWEGVDYDFNTGQYFDNPAFPSTTNTLTNSYYNQVGTATIDYFAAPDAGAQHAFRPGVGSEVTGDISRQAWLNAAAGDPTIKDYDVGWYDGGDWNNYTHTYPSGVFNVWARMSSPSTATLTLGQVTNGWGTATQAVQTLGACALTGGLGWGTYSWVQMTDINGNPVNLTLGGTNTLRVTTSGNANSHFFMLVVANTNLPTITGLYPNGSTLFQATNKLAFIINSSVGVNVSSIKVVLGATNQLLHSATVLTPTNGLSVSGSSTAAIVTYTGLLPNTLYTAVMSAKDTDGNTTTSTTTFDTYNPVFTWEAEDFDYNSGQYIYPTPIDAYFGQGGTEGVDFHDTANGGNEVYRVTTMSTDNAGDTPRANYLAANGGAGTNDYAIGYFSLSATLGNEWLNFTRPFPGGAYNLYGRFAAGGGTSYLDLSRVTNGFGTSSQQLQDIGSFTIGNTGGWGTYGWTPLRDQFSNLVQLTLSGSTNTLRFTRSAGGDVNINFFMLLPAETDLPTITQVYPNGFLNSTDQLVFTASDTIAGINTNNIHVTINGVDVTAKLVFSGSSSNWTVSLSGALAPDAAYTAVITVTNNNGTVVSTTVNFDTFSAASFTWETEDYDYGGGLFFDNPQTNAYALLAGVSNIDYHLAAGGGTDPYRTGLLDGSVPATEITGDFLRAAFNGTGKTDYDLGFTATGNWENYTRTYPAGAWNVYARLARGAAGTGVMGLSKVTGGWGTTNQSATRLGSFSISYSGGWQSWEWVPLLNAQNQLTTLALNGSTNTLRFDDGGANVNFFTLVPALAIQPSLSAGNIRLSFGTQSGFNYTVQYKNNLTDPTWTALSTVAGDGTVKVATDALGSKRFYRLYVH